MIHVNNQMIQILYYQISPSIGYRLPFLSDLERLLHEIYVEWAKYYIAKHVSLWNGCTVCKKNLKFSHKMFCWFKIIFFDYLILFFKCWPKACFSFYLSLERRIGSRHFWMKTKSWTIISVWKQTKALRRQIAGFERKNCKGPASRDEHWQEF